MMKNNKSKVLLLVFIIVLSVSMMWGCSNDDKKTSGETSGVTQSNNDKEEGVTLTVYGNAGDMRRPYMQNIFKLYEEKTGNKLDLQGLDESNFDTVALTKFQTGDIPDLFMHFGGYSLDAYNPKENFVDFTDAEWVDDIQDNVIGQTMREGVVYGLPFWEASLSGTVYNKRIFENLGIEIPKTQAEFDAVCDTLLENGIQPVYMAVKDTWPLLYQFGMDPLFEDEQLLKDINSNKTTYSDIPEMADMLTWYKESADKGYFGDLYMSDTWDYSNELLGTGEAAMMFVWDTWLYTDYDSESYEYGADDFGLMPLFLNTTETGTFEGPNCSLMLANKNSDKVDAATEFINFMADPENYNVAFDGIATAPVFKNQTTIETTPQYDEVVDWVAEVGRASIANPEIIGFSQADGGKAIQELLVGNVDVQGALKLMDEARIKIATSQQVEGFVE